MEDMHSNERLIGELIGKVDQHIATTTAFMQEIRNAMISIRDEKKSDHNEIYARIKNSEDNYKEELTEIYDRLGSMEKTLEGSAGYKKGFLAAISLLSGLSGGTIAILGQRIYELFGG